MNWYKKSKISKSDLPSIKKKTRTREEEYEECPHCGKEIGEKELYCGDGSTWVHRSCGGKCSRGEPSEEAKKMINMFMKENGDAIMDFLKQ